MFSSDVQGIQIELDIVSVPIKIDTAVPLGLIVNKLITNALKYAFTGRDDGIISVGLQLNEHEYHLRVADNGIGMDEDIIIGETGTLGLELVNNLVGQLDGSLEVKRQGGTAFHITFPAAD